MIQKVVYWTAALGLSLGFMVCLCGGLAWPVDLIFNLVIGWVIFLARVAPDIAVNWESVLTAGVCLAGIAYGSHRFLNWFHGQLQKSSSEGRHACRWHLRWTLSLLAVVVLMFVAGISAVGVAHQTVWLISSPEPLLGGGLRDAALRVLSSNNLKQVGSALHLHHEAFENLPPGITVDEEGRLLHGWLTSLLPFIEQDILLKQIDLKTPWDDPRNAPHFRVDVPTFRHPAVKEAEADGFAAAHYAGNVHVIGREKPLSLNKDFSDGTSNTILAGEVAGNFKPWGHPMNWRDPAKGVSQSLSGFGSPIGRDAQFVFADGSVRSISSTVSPGVLKALSTPNGGEPIPKDY